MHEFPVARLPNSRAILTFALFEKGSWRRLHRRLGDLPLTFVWQQKQRQEQIPPAPLFQRGKKHLPTWLGYCA